MIEKLFEWFDDKVLAPRREKKKEERRARQTDVENARDDIQMFKNMILACEMQCIMGDEETIAASHANIEAIEEAIESLEEFIESEESA
jgi:hypothetical protein